MKALEIVLIFACIAASTAAYTQHDQSTIAIDSAFQIARQKAFKGELNEAREMLIDILELDSLNLDARLLLARTYAWDRLYDLARVHLHKINAANPFYEEALYTSVDVECWDQQYQRALAAVEKGLVYFPVSEELLYRKANILGSLNHFEDAITILDTLLSINPAHEDGIFLKRKLNIRKLKYAIGIKYGLDVFNHHFDPSHYTSIQVSRVNAWGSSILRINHVYRFSAHGTQPELELYPKISKRLYAYVNYGTSASTLFPKHRFGGEVYDVISKNIEVSIGFRHLYFNPYHQITMYTGSIAWYGKKYWISFRPTLISDQIMTTCSSSLTTRRYFENEESYIDIFASVGLLPEERKFQSGLADTRNYSLRSKSGGVAWQKSLSDNFSLKATLEITCRELAFDANESIWMNSVTIGLQKKF